MTPNIFHVYSTKDYRQDIQGIRAIGALLIMIYHLWLGKVSGGVDIFFVISGYFMATVILSRLAKQGDIAPIDFWGKIIKRIAPSAYTVLLATLVFSYLFIPETQWIRVVDETIASALHLENLQLMKTSVDYFARNEPASAVQQFWAMSIQMQFYVVLPAIFFIGVVLARWRRSVSPIVAIFSCIAAASFIYSVVATYRSPETAYFSPLTRSWEFFCGVLSALLIPLITVPSRIRQVLSYIGLAAVLLTGFVIPKTAPFPGYVAAMPVLAAVFLLLSNPQGLSNWVGRLLMHPILAFLGGISFTIYLWHWPLLIFYKEATGAATIGLLPGLGIMALAITLAYLTTRFIETPLRSRPGERASSAFSPFLLGFKFALPVVLAAFAVKLFFSFMIRDYRADYSLQFDGPEVSIQTDARAVPYQQFLFAKRLLPQAYLEGCNQNPASSQVKTCAYGDTSADKVIALVGGSHALQWLPTLDVIGKTKGFKIVNITKSLCPFGHLEDSHPSCEEWNKNVVDYLAELQPLLVVTNSTRAAEASVPEHVPTTYVDQWKALEERNITMIGIRDNPRFPFDPADCIARNKPDPLTCSAPKSEILLADDPAQPLVEDLDKIKIVDMTNYFCTSETCVTVYRDLIMYSDAEHISVAYAAYLATALHTKFADVLPEIFNE